MEQQEDIRFNLKLMSHYRENLSFYGISWCITNGHSASHRTFILLILQRR